jgi:hypothetical protein
MEIQNIFRLTDRLDFVLLKVYNRFNILHLHQVVIKHFPFLFVKVALLIHNYQHRRIELLPDLIVNILHSQLWWLLARYHRIVELWSKAEIDLHLVIEVCAIDQFFVQ